MKTHAPVKTILAWAHLWIGLIFCIPFLLLGLTGSILVYEDEIDAMLSPAPHAHTAGAPQSPKAIIDAGLQARPGMIAASLSMPDEPGAAAIVRLQRKPDQNAPQRGRPPVTQVFVDPVSLAVLDTRAGFRSPFLGMVHALHGGMMIGGREGRSVVGWLGVGMVALGLSGIVLWWPRNGKWRAAYGVKRNARGWLFHRQLHGTTGITAWIVFVIVSFSGVAIAFPQSVGGGLGAIFGKSALAPQGPGQPQLRIHAIPDATALDADAMLAAAQAAAPQTRLSAMFLPTARTQPARVMLTPENTIFGAPAISVALDPYSGSVLDLRDPRSAGATDAILLWQRPLHTGRGIGPIWRALVFIVGFLPLLFSITGIAMWWTKRRSRRMAATQGDPALQAMPAE